MAMPLTIRPLSDAMGGEIAGIDLRNPLDDTTFAAIETALDDHLVIVFRNQDLDPPALAAFGQRFGKLRPHALESYRHKEHEDVSYIRNVDDEGNFDPFGKIRASTWHADATYEADLPRAAILHAKEIPASGGGTIFANMCAAYDGLPGEKQDKLADLVALHGYTTGPAGSYYQGKNDYADVYPEQRRPSVLPHPRTGRPILFVNPMHVHGFEGLEEKDALAIVEDMASHAEQCRFVYHHHWQVGDVLVWDEQATMHRGAGDTPEGQRRVLLRTIVYPH